MWIYGFHPVREALRGEARISRVVLARQRRSARVDEVRELCARAGISCEEISPEELDRLGPGVHNGFAAEVQGEDGFQTPVGDPNLVVLLEDIQDPRNLGALLRVCDGAGVGQVLVRDRGSAKLTPVAIKSSAGSAEWLPVERITNTANTLERHKEKGFWCYGAAEEGDPVWDVDFTGPVVLCLGGEEKGLRKRTRSLCDRLVALPMLGKVGSLNVATAAAALLYEAVRQRRA